MLLLLRPFHPVYASVTPSETMADSSIYGDTVLPSESRSSSNLDMNGKKQKNRLENILFKLKKPEPEADSVDSASPEQGSNSHGSAEASNGKDSASAPAWNRSVLESPCTITNTSSNRRASRKPTRREKGLQMFDDLYSETPAGSLVQQEGEGEDDDTEAEELNGEKKGTACAEPADADKVEVQPAYTDSPKAIGKFRIKLEKDDFQDWTYTFNDTVGQNVRRNSFSCEKCGEIFSSLPEYDIHVRSHVKQENRDFSVFPCYICGKSFSSKAFLSQHVLVHNTEVEDSDHNDGVNLTSKGTGGKVFRCGLCRRGFSTEDGLQLHKCSKGLVKPYGCGQCGRCFTHFSNLSSHLAHHKQGIAPEMTCFHCGQRFMYSIELRRHMDVHIKAEALPKPAQRGAKSSSTITSLNDGEQDSCQSADGGSASGNKSKGSLKLTIPFSRFMPKKRSLKRGPPKVYTCSVCGKVFYQRGYLNMHMKVHGEKQHECSYCGKKFTYKKSLEIHVRSHTGEKPYQCQFCKKNFTRQDSLQKHERLHMGVKPYVCETCGRQYPDKFELSRHSLSHSNEKPHKCDVCSKAYSDKKRLKEHMFFHSGILPYICDLCGKGYARKYRYNQHLSQHAGKVRFRCEVCSKGFYRRSDLNSHRETHSDKKPFSCEVCGMGFLRESYLRRHMIVHSSDKPHHCSICGKNFARKNTLRRHLLIHKRREEGMNEELGGVGGKYSSYTADFGYCISGAVAPYAVSSAEERDIMKDIQAVIGLDENTPMF